MGYDIRHELTYTGKNADFTLAVALMGDAEAVISKLIGESYFFEQERVSQDKMNEAMLQVSKKYPEILFKVHSEGEENDDISDHYYQNGKSAHYEAVVMIPPLDPAHLK
jgi:hypothetical protein